jgi:hypothetical protein
MDLQWQGTSLPWTSFGNQRSFMSRPNDTSGQVIAGINAGSARELQKMQDAQRAADRAQNQWATQARLNTDFQLGTAANQAKVHGDNLGFQAAQNQLGFQERKFDSVFPYLTGQMDKLFDSRKTGVQSQNLPVRDTNVDQIYSNDWVNQSINRADAFADMATANQQRGIRNSSAGRGFGANSPLAAALTNRSQRANLATKVGNRRDVMLQAEEANQRQRFANQQSQVQRDLALNEADVDRKRLEQDYYATTYSPLIAALAGIV